MKKGLRYCCEFANNPFIKGEKLVDVYDVVLKLSKSALELMYYILDTKAFLEDKFVLDINEFKKFTNKKSDTSAIQALGELCSVGIIAKTRVTRVYWVNKDVFVNEKAVDFIKAFFRYKKGI